MQHAHKFRLSLPADGGRMRYPFDKLNPGESLYVVGPVQRVDKVRVAAVLWGKRNGARFASSHDGNGITIWRLADSDDASSIHAAQEEPQSAADVSDRESEIAQALEGARNGESVFLEGFRAGEVISFLRKWHRSRINAETYTQAENGGVRVFVVHKGRAKKARGLKPKPWHNLKVGESYFVPAIETPERNLRVYVSMYCLRSGQMLSVTREEGGCRVTRRL